MPALTDPETPAIIGRIFATACFGMIAKPLQAKEASTIYQ
jgi:hypothetical protein